MDGTINTSLIPQVAVGRRMAYRKYVNPDGSMLYFKSGYVTTFEYDFVPSLVLKSIAPCFASPGLRKVVGTAAGSTIFVFTLFS
jgi:hypothetical protein